MKFATILNSESEERLCLLEGENHYDLQKHANHASIELPNNMNDFLYLEEKGMELASKVIDKIKNDGSGAEVGIKKILAPVSRPTSCRDAYAFRQHVASARRNRGVDMIPEFDEFPIFYFTNHNAVFGEGDVIVEKDHLHKLDFELEWAAVIGKRGKNVNAENADSYIAGYTIMNDLSARLLQMEEMKLNLGPAKGKDFATTIGPFMITPDELEQYRSPGAKGLNYNLRMKAYHNGKQVSDGNTGDMTYTFAEIIERISYGVDIRPGEVIGSGTVGTGCYLELNGTWKREAGERGETHEPIWLEDGDKIELEIDMLGKLSNTIELRNGSGSILEKKRKV
ncbi:MAG: fumarylacetoacetate hydrolase family protein [Candidatus Kapaibacteriales bacterium]